MNKDERLRRMEELLDKENFDLFDYEELIKLEKEMESERRKIKEKYRKAVHEVK